ncbi:histidine kinase sensor domain-containing protein [Microbulbifer harenosus]|uniref:histidine kinase n=1 Tax=Microbulbifer harenosus TaxID=2576840 RepID=A0ABY2UHW3_9GAMM|nr:MULTISPECIES: histidine kinase sensor domain-containing protein [Microbulbifer]QIL91368.1 HAMP domain-containing protein [Microbulbifer sp. SH-1]TLM77207.1 HAMP domain-containing protein [Microbulbifer harenosus]
MNRRLLWKLILLITAGIVAMFYLINYVTVRAEEEMSMLSQAHRDELRGWGREAQALYSAGDAASLERWLDALQQRESTLAAVVGYNIHHVAGSRGLEDRYSGNNLGRDVEWKIHLYFEANPVMEIPFEDSDTSFIVLLPDRMRPGSYWQTTRLLLQIFLPALILAILSVLLYRHIMQPLGSLQRATREFSRGDFSVRVRPQLGSRRDEFSELASTFDQMAARIGEQLLNQRQLIADFSHELRTPLTRLEIAIESLGKHYPDDPNVQRLYRESRHFRKLTEDTLALAWLDNEQPRLTQESMDLVDLIDVIVDDARFEFPDRPIQTHLPDSAGLHNSSHQAVGQALENILRNALRYNPVGRAVEVALEDCQLASGERGFQVTVKDCGPGVPEDLLETIFRPFYQADPSRNARGTESGGVGLGLALARRQLKAVGGQVVASNRSGGGLCMTISLPAN